MVKPISKKQSDRLRRYAQQAKRWKAGKRCCYPGCKSKHIDVHHTRGKLGDLLFDERFWKPLCRKHHNWAHDNIEKARSLGLFCEGGLWNTPER